MTERAKKNLVMLAARFESTAIVYNYLKKDFDFDAVIIEERVPALLMAKRRIKRLGLFTVIGQILFQTLVTPYLRWASRDRARRIKLDNSLNDDPIDRDRVIHVKSVNDDPTIEILRELNPHVVIVNGTRIISERVLTCIPAKFINMHAGITPMYRGVHGAYWALVENNLKACGVTVYYVDPGIDTGQIIDQGLIQPSKEDTFVTYPLLQLATGLPLLKKATRDICNGECTTKPAPENKSKLRTHPTIFEYLWYRFGRGVR
ncbi:MAG: formyl transferase [bacterium]